MPYTIYDPVRDCDISTPVGLRITDGPEMLERKVPWEDDAIFFRVEDTSHGLVRYCTQTETLVITGCSVTYLYKKTVERKTRRPFRHRWLIDPVPKGVFIRQSGRTHRIIKYYKYTY